VVDGNVIRVFSRFWRLGEEADGPVMKRLLRERLTPAMAGFAPGFSTKR
jgi:adenine-specific DNA glycosylase